MAVFNGEKHLKEQLQSILAQKMQADEIVICDDSDNTRSFEVIEPFIKQNPGLIKYHKNDTCLGVSKNFEKAIALTTGDIIFLSDQDDIWREDKITQLVSLLNASPSCGGAFCNSELVDDDLKPLGCTHWDLRSFYDDAIDTGNNGRLDFFVKRVPVAGHNMAFKSRLKDLVLPFPELEECHDTWLGLIIEATERWAFISECLTQFRQHDSNLSQAGRFSQLQEAVYSIKNNRCSWNEVLYNNLLERLSQAGNKAVDGAVWDLLRDRCEHCRVRSQMNCNIFKRLPMICGEISNKRYFKYGRGWKNVIQDMVLRSFCR